MITAKEFRERGGTLADKVTSALFNDGTTIASEASPLTLDTYANHGHEVYLPLFSTQN